jgi:hypothetical protein
MRHSSKRSYWLAVSSVLVVGLVVAIAIAAALAPTLLPSGDRIGWEGRSVAAGVIFVGSYLALAIGRVPGLGSGVAISFWDYFRVGAPLTIITLAIGTLWLWL